MENNIKEESRLKFQFAENDTVIKFDDTKFYRDYFNKLPEAKGVDFMSVAKDKIAFIEVKTRTNTRFGLAAEAVDQRKQRKILLAVKQYIAQMQPKEKIFSLDVMEVYLGNQIKINHIKNAFQE